MESELRSSEADASDITAPEDLTLPSSFAVNSDESANWVIRRIVEARGYSERCAEWCRREQARARHTEQFFLWRFGSQLTAWAQRRIDENGGRRKSISVPAGTAGFRHEAAKLVIDDEGAVIAWAKCNNPNLVVVTESISKSALNTHVSQTGELPNAGVRLEPERERFYIK